MKLMVTTPSPENILYGGCGGYMTCILVTKHQNIQLKFKIKLDNSSCIIKMKHM